MPNVLFAYYVLTKGYQQISDFPINLHLGALGFS